MTCRSQEISNAWGSYDKTFIGLPPHAAYHEVGQALDLSLKYYACLNTY